MFAIGHNSERALQGIIFYSITGFYKTVCSERKVSLDVFFQYEFRETSCKAHPDCVRLVYAVEFLSDIWPSLFYASRVMFMLSSFVSSLRFLS